jgi:uncharacterized membrane protein
MSNYTGKLSDEVTETKLNSLAAEYASLKEVYHSGDSDNECDWSATQNNNNLLIWLEHTVQVEINAPIYLVWHLWSDLEQMPRWMKWIDSVKVLEDDSQLSRWKFAGGGFQFTWLSRIHKLVPYQIIKWESVEGSPNRGVVRFYDRHGSSIVKFTVAYALPGIFEHIMDNLLVERLVKSALQGNLEQFRDYVSQMQSGLGFVENL